MNVTRYFMPLYLLTLLLLGMGYLCVLPPFEGVDEPAHFSSIRQIAALGTIPVLGKSFLDEAANRYQGPRPYSTGVPPFDKGLTYPKFFARTDLVRRYAADDRAARPPVPFRASSQPNWEAQQPPLYYALLAPFDKLADFLSASFYSRLFLFRLVSYLMALTGVGLGFAAARDHGKPLSSDPAVLGFLLYPLLLPQFFDEFARIGNDSLCLSWAGLAAFLISKWIHRDGDRRLSLGIGLVLGLGLLTKAFFVPIIAALGLWLLVRHFSGTRAPKSWVPACLILLPAMLVGGAWYVFNFFAVGTFSASYDMVNLASRGGFAANLGKNFHVSLLVSGIAAMFTTYSWGGTWSLVRMPTLLQLLLIVPAAAAFASFLSSGFVGSTLLRQRSFDRQFRASNVGELRGGGFDTLVCAGVPAQKWIAERDPEGDLRNIQQLADHLGQARVGRFILISTVDVFADSRGCDEQTPVEPGLLTAYGRNRYWLEQFVAERFENSLIVRLPGLVGPGLRKNAVFDFHHHNNLDLIDARSVYQFYPMVNLWSDLDVALEAGIKLLHLAAEPMTVAQMAAGGFARSFANQVAGRAPAVYDMRSRHAAIFGGQGGYQYSRRESLLAIRAYAQSEPAEKPAA